MGVVENRLQSKYDKLGMDPDNSCGDMFMKQMDKYGIECIRMRND